MFSCLLCQYPYCVLIKLSVVLYLQEGNDANMTDAMDTSTLESQILRDEASFIQSISRFFNQEELSDVVLKVGETSFFCHKFVLAKSSDVFKTMLYEEHWSAGVQGPVELDESVECRPVFDKFLQYLYTAEVSINTASAVGILCLADKYNVTSLKNLCTTHMVENSRSPCLKNAITWYSWAKALHLPDLIEQCSKTIAWNFQEMMTSPEWLRMDLDFLVDLLDRSELVVDNEFAIWEGVSHWLSQESHADQFTEASAQLLPLIRFPQMLVSQIFRVEQSELYNSECHTHVHGLISSAYRFRSLCPSQAPLGVNFGQNFYMPRDYKDLIVDTVRMQNTLRFGIQVDVKMYKGPVPIEERTGDWKITYRKQNDLWTLQLFAHESSLVGNAAKIQATVIVSNDEDKPIQVHREATLTCQRGNTVSIQIPVQQTDASRSMAVLIKPVSC